MRLIDADELKEYMRFPDDRWTRLTHCIIDNAPTIEAEPVKHGKWNCYYDEDFDSEVIECSKCGERFLSVLEDAEYFMTNCCPNCGARMDGEEDGEEKEIF
jgi:DNA-directed RNA polymerase subunit RPC12/RpoP